MPMSILVPVDGSKNSDRAVHHAVGLAKAAPGSSLHLLNVQPSVGSLGAVVASQANVEGCRREEGDKALASALKICAESGVEAVPHIGVGRPGSVIGEFVKRLGCQTVVMGTRGCGGIAGLLLGSVAQDVIAHVDVRVCLVE